MEKEQAAFAFYRIVKRTIGFGDICMVVSDDPQVEGRERITIECRFNSGKGNYAVNVVIDLFALSRMGDEGIRYRAAAEGERIRMQLNDKGIGLLARSLD